MFIDNCPSGWAKHGCRVAYPHLHVPQGVDRGHIACVEPALAICSRRVAVEVLPDGVGAAHLHSRHSRCSMTQHGLHGFRCLMGRPTKQRASLSTNCSCVHQSMQVTAGAALPFAARTCRLPNALPSQGSSRPRSPTMRMSISTCGRPCKTWIVARFSLLPATSSNCRHHPNVTNSNQLEVKSPPASA